MIYNIVIKESVREKINEISKYIYQISFDVNASTKVYNYIFQEIFWLKVFPNRNPKFNNIFRVLTISKKYRIFYKVDEKQKIVFVSNIFFSREDYFNKF